MHVLLLADAVRPVGGLIFLGRVPRSGEMNDVIRRLNVDAESNSQGRKHDRAEPGLLLKCFDAPLAIVRACGIGRRVPVDHIRFEPESLNDRPL